MSIFDIFDNNAAQQAAQDQIAGLNQGYGLASGNINQAIQSLATNFGAGSNAVQSGYNTATGAVQGGANTAAGALNTGYGGAIGSLGSNYAAALQPYLQNYGQAQQGTTALANALGLNGGAGNAQATAAAYASNPAFQFQLNQGSQNVLRNAAATGTTASGATLNALQQQGQGLANSTYQQYVSNLTPYLSASQNAASGINSTLTGLGTGLAGLQTGLGTAQAGLATGTAGSLANLATGQGTQLANLSTGLGTSTANQYDTLANLGYQYATGVGNANANAALANNQASANIFNALGSAASLGASIFSDERLKEDIEPVGELYDGTGVYRYRYLWDDPDMRRIGVMAQEVEQTRPDAVREIGGYKAVDYGDATDLAASLARFVDDSSNVVAFTPPAERGHADVFADFLEAA